MLTLLLDIPQRKIFHIEQKAKPACFLIVDHKAGGILVNTPDFSEPLLKELTKQSDIDYLFFPSKFGCHDLQEWKTATGAESIAHELEADAITPDIDLKVNHKTKLTRTMDFVPMGGRTKGSCALFLKNLPGILFLGPTLSVGENQWPALIENDDDESFESRMFGVLGLKDLKYDYVFTDDFDPDASKFGPGASEQVSQNIDLYFK